MSEIRVTQARVDDIMDNSKVEVTSIWGKCTVVAVQFPNGFVVVESSACVDPENYDLELGKSICLDRIKDKIWLFEGYKLQCEIANRQEVEK